MFSVFLSLLAAAASPQAVFRPAPPPITKAPVPPTTEPPIPAPFGPDRKRSGVHLPGLFRTDDYPLEAIRNEEQGTVFFRLSIGKDGVATRCDVTASSGSASLDTTTCAILQQRGRFQPERGPDGRAIEHVMDGAIAWELPPAPPADILTHAPNEGPSARAVDVPVKRAAGYLPGLFRTEDYPQEALRNEETGTVAFSIAIDRDGRASNCVVTTSSGSASLDATTCIIIESRARFSPALDAAGRRVGDHAQGRIRWDLPPMPPMPFADEKMSLVFTIVDGVVTKCGLESSVTMPSGELCSSMMDLAKKFVADERAQNGFVTGDLIYEQGFIVGGPDAARSIGQGRGETRVRLNIFTLDIDAAGKIARCDPAVDNAGSQGAEMCADTAKRLFEPLKPGGKDRSDRHGSLYVATYTRSGR